MYGNCVASSLDLVRGCKPSMNVEGHKFVLQQYFDGCGSMEARRLLATIIKSRPGSHRNDIEIGESVLVLLPGHSRPMSHWEEHRFEVVCAVGSIVVGRGRFRKMIASMM